MTGIALLVNVTTEQRPAYKSFLAQQGDPAGRVSKAGLPKSPSPGSDPLASNESTSSFLEMMYVIQWGVLNTISGGKMNGPGTSELVNGTGPGNASQDLERPQAGLGTMNSSST